MQKMDSIEKNEFSLLSVIIITYNREDDLTLTLKMCLRNDFYPLERLELIVIDNGSEAGTYETVKEYFPKVKYIRLKRNYGIYARNIGMEKAKGKYLLLLDDDSYPISDLRNTIKYIDNNEKIGIISCKILQNNKYLKPRPLEFFGCGTIIRKKVVEEIGGFPRWIFIYHDELEYGLRTVNAGYSIICGSKCIILHKGSSQNRINLIKKQARDFTHLLSIYHAHFNWSKKVFLIFLAHISLFISIVFIEISYKVMIKGILSFLNNLKQISKSELKKEVQNLYVRYYIIEKIKERIKRALHPKSRMSDK